MKFKWNKRIATCALIAALVSVALIFCVSMVVNYQKTWETVINVVDVFAPITYGFVIAYFLNPIFNFFERKLLKKINRKALRRTIAVTLTYVVSVLALLLVIGSLVPQLTASFNDLQKNLAVYADSLDKWIENVSAQSSDLGKFVAWLTETVGYSNFNATLTNFLKFLYNIVEKFSPFILSFFGSFAVQLKNIVIGLIFAGYLLCSKELLLAQINKLTHVFFEQEKIDRIADRVKTTDKIFGKYLVGTLLDAAIVGSITATGMLILSFITGMPREYIVLVSVIIASTNIIPIFGPFIGTIPSAVIIFINSPINALWFIIMMIIIQQVDANLIVPRIQGDATGLPALYVIIAITVMGGLFGIGGMIIGVPLFAVLGSIISEKTNQRINKSMLEFADGAETTRDGYTSEDYEGFDEFDDYTQRPEPTNNDDIALSQRYGEQSNNNCDDSEVDGK